MLRKLISFVVILVALAALAASGSGLQAVDAQAPTGNFGSLRVVNALVGIGSVDVYLDKVLIIYDLQPKEAAAYYLVASGKHQVTVRAVGASALSIPIADILVDIAPNNSITAIAYQKVFYVTNEFAAPDIDQAGAFFVMNDDRSPAPLGRSRLSVAHLAVDTPQNISIGYRSGEALLYHIGLELPFGTIDIDAGAQTLAVIDAETPDLRVLANFGDWSFYSNTLYTLIVVPDVQPSNPPGAVGLPSSTPQMFIISAPLDPPAKDGIRLRIIHAAHDTAVLDVYVDERLVARRFNYGRYTEYLGLANYGHTITLRRFGDSVDAPPLGRAIFTINSENRDQTTWTLLLVNAGGALLNTTQDGTNAPVIINTGGGQVMAAILPDNISETQPNYARLRVINAVDGVQAVGLYTPAYPAVEPIPGEKPTPTPIPTPGVLPEPFTLVGPVQFGAEANDSEVPVGAYTELNFVPEGTRNNIEQLTNQQLVNGLVYTYILMGSPTGDPRIQVVTLEDYGVGIPKERQYIAIITNQQAPIRATPSTSAQTLGSLRRDNQIMVLGRSVNSQWLRIRFENPQNGRVIDGWVSSSVGMTITRLGAPVTKASLPVYNGP